MCIYKYTKVKLCVCVCTCVCVYVRMEVWFYALPPAKLMSNTKSKTLWICFSSSEERCSGEGSTCCTRTYLEDSSQKAVISSCQCCRQKSRKNAQQKAIWNVSMAANCHDTTSTMIKVPAITSVTIGPWVPTPWISEWLPMTFGHFGHPWSSSSKWSSVRSARPRKTSEPTGPNGKRRRWKHRRTNRFLDVWWLVQL